MINKYLTQAFITLVTFTVVLALLFALFTWGPDVEAKMYPVLSEYTIEKETVLSPNDVVLSGFFNKNRGNCRPDRITGYLTNDSGTSNETVKIVFPRAPLKYNIFPEGKQAFGPMLVMSETGLADKTLVLTAYHDCHKLWLSRSNLVSYKLENY